MQQNKFKSAGAVNSHLSDGHQLIYGVLKSGAPRQPPRTVHYQSFKNFQEADYITDLQSAPFHVSEIFEDPEDSYWYVNNLLQNIINEHVPTKTKVVRAKHTPFMNKKLSKAIMNKPACGENINNIPLRKNGRHTADSVMLQPKSDGPLSSPISRKELLEDQKMNTSGKLLNRLLQTRAVVIHKNS